MVYGEKGGIAWWNRHSLPPAPRRRGLGCGGFILALLVILTLAAAGYWLALGRG